MLETVDDCAYLFSHQVCLITDILTTSFCVSPMGKGWSILDRECYCTTLIILHDISHLHVIVLLEFIPQCPRFYVIVSIYLQVDNM